MKEETKPEYPMRINKYLALKGYSTRRGADELIEAKKVLINGKLALLGSKVNEEDNVEVKGKTKHKPYIYLAFYKPKGVITHSPQMGEKEIKNLISFKDVFDILLLQLENIIATVSIINILFIIETI